MSEDEEHDCPECKKGLPAYLATFADLMSLLMCFFVLLLAFSEMDVQKYRQIAGSMKDAFGVQDQVKVKEMPKGTSIIAQEFSPGRPDPTPLNEVRQSTSETMQETLDVLCSPGQSEQREDAKNTSEASAEQSAMILERLVSMTQADAMEVASTMKQEIQSGAVEVETKKRKIIIRVKEQGSFPSGSATLRASFIPIMDKIRDALKQTDGIYSVEGHTDDVPISTSRFRSNWELSTARAVSVAHELMKGNVLEENNFTVVGYGETKPMASNDSEENRARNRRVEIIIEQGSDDEKYLSGEEPLPEDPEFNVDLLREAGLENLEGFQLLDGKDNELEWSSTPADEVISVLGEEGEPDSRPSSNTSIDPKTSGQESPQSEQDDFDLSKDPFGPSQSVRDDEFF